MALNCKRDFDIIAVSGGGISWAMCKSVLLTKNLWTFFWKTVPLSWGGHWWWRKDESMPIHSNSIMHHYECVALCKDGSLQRGRFCTRSLASCIPRSSKDRSAWMFFIQVVQDPTCHWLQSVFCVPFSALTVLAWRQEGHLFSKNVCSLSPEVFFMDKWRKSSKGNWLTQVHLQTGCSSGDRHVKIFSTYWSYDSRWRKLIKDVWRTGWVWGGECFFWYRPTQVVPDKSH